MGLVYKKCNLADVGIMGYCDLDYVADLDRRRSLTSYIFTYGGNVIS